MAREQEFEIKRLGEGWVEVRLVYNTFRPEHRDCDYHVRGNEARIALMRYILSFAAGLANAVGSRKTEREIRDVWKALHARHCRGCAADRTQH